MFNAYIDHVAPAFEYLATNITETTKTFRKMTGNFKKTIIKFNFVIEKKIFLFRFWGSSKFQKFNGTLSAVIWFNWKTNCDSNK